MWTSTTFESLSKFMSQTCSAMSVRDRASPARRASSASSPNSFGVRSSFRARPDRGEPDRVDFQVRDAEDLRLRAGPTPQDRPDAGEELGEGERLDEVIVRPQLEAPHPVGDGVHRGQEQDRRVPPGFPQLGDDRPALAAGEHHVEHDQVIVARPGQVQAVVPAECDVNCEPRLDEALAHVVDRLAVILDK